MISRKSFISIEDFVHTGVRTLFITGIGIVFSYIESKYKETQEAQFTQKISIEALACLAESHDADTWNHLNRIQEYVRLLATELKERSSYSTYLTRKPGYIDELVLASLLHDIGKIVIPKEILAKPDRLNRKEIKLLRTHPIVAGEMLEKTNSMFVEQFHKDSYFALARDIAYYHHEKWNGEGYPYGLSGEAIPLSARIVAVADVYDALTSQRPYKSAWSHEDAVNEIKKERGQHFDPEVVDAFLTLADNFQEISAS